MYDIKNVATLHARLCRARQVLSGCDEHGMKRYNAMTDPGVISLAHGDGTRRPHPTVIAQAIQSCFPIDGWSFDDYHFMREYDPLLSSIRENLRPLLPKYADSLPISVDSGTSRLFSTYLTVHSRPGDILLIPRPYYHGVIDWCAATGVIPFVILTERNTHYKVTVEDLDRTISELGHKRVCGLLLANPTFTGSIFDPQELELVIRWAKKRNINILLDIIFRGTEFPRSQTYTGLYPDMDMSGMLVFGGVSKAYNLANLRVGWVIGDPKLVAPMDEYRECTMGAVPFLCQAMATAALRAPSCYLHENALECESRVDLISRLISELNKNRGEQLIEIEHRPYAGHGLLISMHSLLGGVLPDGTIIEDSIDVCRYLLEEHALAISPSYSQGFDGLVFRIAFGSVGLHKTYAYSSRSEEGVLSHIREIITGANVQDVEILSEMTKDGFMEGRQLLILGVEKLYKGLAALRP